MSALLLLFATSNVVGATNNYTENQGLINLSHDTTIYDGVEYSGGSLVFDITNSTTNDQITIADDGTASTVNNELSVVGSNVYIGNGNVATLVGAVDSIENGQNGQPLKVNFSNDFQNADYTIGNLGDTVILGWTTVLSQIRLGIDNIAGQATPLDPTYTPQAVDDTDIATRPGSLVVALSDEILGGSDGFSARLTSSGITTANGYDVVRGPAIYSDSTISVETGDTLSFDWRALGGGDAYDVFGYIIDIDNGTTQILLDETGSSASATTAWATVTQTIAQTGRYRFVFISGTYDFTGGLAAGAQLFLDSYRVSQANPPKPILKINVEALATKIRFKNDSDDIDDTTRNVTITALDNVAETDTTTTTIVITAVNDAPVAFADSYSVDEGATLNQPVNTGVLINDTDIDSNTLTAIKVTDPAYGVLTLNGDGSFSYNHDGSEASADSFTYKANDTLLDSNTVKVSIVINPVNDIPVYSGDQSGEINEDGSSITGNLNITDGDTGESTMVAQTNSSNSNGYGSFSMDVNGAWTYAIDNSNPAVQLLAEDATLTETFTVMSLDGTTPQVITITIAGVNGIATITGSTSGALNEDVNTAISGSLSVSDEDTDEALLVAQSNTEGQYGSFTIDNTGNWLYNLDNTKTAVQALADGSTLTDSFVVTSADGTANETVTVTITGVNGEAAITGTATGGIDEDMSTAISGSLSVSDEDSGEAVVVAQTDVVGEYGHFSINSAGEWLYTLDNTNTEVQALANGSTLTDSFVVTSADGTGTETVVVTINAHNDAPILVNDEFVRSFEDEMVLDVLSNDSDPEGDELVLVTATANIGTVDIVDGQLIYTPLSGFSGDMIINYSVADSEGSTASATVTLMIESDAMPVITLPADLCGEYVVNADALYTRADLGEVSAVDQYGNALPVSLVDGKSLFAPGINEALWQATDSEGNTAIAKQLVCVMPLISIEKDQTVLEGESATISVYLNGQSPVYPVIIPFDVIGGEDDITLASGEAVIESGTEVHLSFNILDDGLVEENEVVQVLIGSAVNRGDKYAHNLTITEGNIAPKVSLMATQAQEQRLMVSQQDGNVTIGASVYDPNTLDTHDYQWSSGSELITNISTEQTQFIFDPSGLNAGLYTFSLVANDSATPPGKGSATLYIEVVENLAVLGSADSDGDLIPDNIEGYADTDGDGIPDYLDRINECNVLQEEALVNDGYLIEGQSGVCLRRGDLTIGGETGGAQITEGDIDGSTDDALTPDPDAINIGGVFDYIAYGLPNVGQNFAIVMPQRKPIPANAVYRKYRQDTGWDFFIEDANNSLWSAQGEAGYCPPPSIDGDNETWAPGLTEGHWCVLQIIEDGGVNDDDDEANGTVVDPGGVAVMKTDNHLPIAVDDSMEYKLNTAVRIYVLANDSDIDNDVLNLTSATSSIGSVSIIDNVLLYQPDNNYAGDVTLDYGISDGNGGTDYGIVSLSFVASNTLLVLYEESNIEQG
ncbi:MAG: tandem-95 repeat protein, partial [Psychromonas sp.]|nr:tandem-95 repeat protein [Psychromonas sp.]